MPAYVLTRALTRRFVAGALLVAGLIAVAIASIGADPTAAATASCKKVDTIRGGANPALAYAPPQIAASQGFMKRYCLKYEVQPVAGAAILLAQMNAGRADVALLNPAGIIQAVQSGIKLRIIAPNTGTGDFGFCVSRNSSITNLKQFEGKSIATTLLGSNTDIAVRVLLARAGVDLNKVKFVQITNASIAQAIINGNVDGGQCNEPNLTTFASRFRVIEANPMAKVFGKDTPVTYAIVTDKYYRSHKSAVQRYQKAYLATARLVSRNTATFRRAAHYFADLPTSVTNKMRLPSLPTTYGIKDLNSQVKALVRFGAIKSSIPQKQLEALFVPLPKA